MPARLAPMALSAAPAPATQWLRPAPAKVALVWNGSQWNWAQWTGVEWKSPPWATASWMQSETACLHPAPGRPFPEAVALRDRRGDKPSALSLVAGHIIASLLGLALGYYLLCWLRPAEFAWPSWPIQIGASSFPGGTDLTALAERFVHEVSALI